MSGGWPEGLARAVRAAGVRDERVLEAIRRTPRAQFVDPALTAMAYVDEPIPIAYGQVTTQPSLSARMIEGLGLTGTEHVLEVGTGLGFQTALLARLAGDVVSIEWWPDLAEQARESLRRHGVRSVEVRVGDGSRGAPDRAPFDAVLVSAAFPEPLPPLAEQLRRGGRLVQPIGTGGQEEVVRFDKATGGLRRGEMLTRARFVPLLGRHADPR